mgnify:FL=1
MLTTIPPFLPRSAPSLRYGKDGSQPKLTSADEARIDMEIREAAAKMGMDSTSAQHPFVCLEFPRNAL